MTRYVEILDSVTAFFRMRSTISSSRTKKIRISRTAIAVMGTLKLVMEIYAPLLESVNALCSLRWRRTCSLRGLMSVRIALAVLGMFIGVRRNFLVVKMRFVLVLRNNFNGL